MQVRDIDLIRHLKAVALLADTVEGDLPFDDLAGGQHELHSREGGDALAAAALADNAQHFTIGNVERDAVQGLGHAYNGVEVGVEVLDAQDCVILTVGLIVRVGRKRRRWCGLWFHSLV